MSPEQVLELVAMGWALLFAYFPVLKNKFNALDGSVKVLIQLGALALVVYGAFAGSCFGLFSYFSCEPLGAGLWAATLLLLKVILANQGMYQVTRLVAKAAGRE